jgi:hypothetical protein
LLQSSGSWYPSRLHSSLFSHISDKWNLRVFELFTIETIALKFRIRTVVKI